MYAGSLPPTSIYSDWTENIELTSVDDGGLVDLSGVSEIQVRLLDPVSKFEELRVALSVGSVTLPSPGIIQWFVPAGAMGTLFPKFYEVMVLIFEGSETIALMLGNISVVE